MACHSACDLTCWSLYQIIPSGQKICQWILTLPLLLWRIPPIFSTPASIYKTIIHTESTLGTYLDTAAIGLAGFLLPHCCHGFGGGCAALFTRSICLEFCLGEKGCDSYRFLSGMGWNPFCCHSSVCALLLTGVCQGKGLLTGCPGAGVRLNTGKGERSLYPPKIF